MHLVTIVVLTVAAVTTGALALYVFYYLPRTMERHLQEALKAFSMAVELRFPSHRGLSARVLVLSRTVGLELGLDAKRLTNLEMATSLRDIGLCAIPYGLVNERHPKAWTDEEASEYERHGEVSGSMLEMVPRLAHLAPIVGNHHVAFASGGALRAPIPLEASILNVVTAYLWAERLQSDLLARDALITQSGTTYDPRVVDALLRVLPSVRVGVSEPASLVRS